MKSGMDSSSASLASNEGAAGPAVAMVDRAGLLDVKFLESLISMKTQHRGLER
jgi:hypothetical protein